jgi:LAS superfamily LD-carboxypeptidase LdcB
MNIDPKVLCGQTDSHIHWMDSNKVGVHQDVVEPVKKLKEAAALAGFELSLCSSFRSFDSQLAIWNAKAMGTRPVLDSQSRVMDISKLAPKELMYSILRWSALPGLSRHHWGTDFDVFDLKQMPKGYQLKLVPEEFEGDGYFAPLHCWLDDNLSKFGFFRPYAQDLGGVSPERWHVSYSPVAQKYFKALKFETIQKIISSTQIQLKETIQEELPKIYERFFTRVSSN